MHSLDWPFQCAIAVQLLEGSDEQKRQGFEVLSMAKAGHADAMNTLGWCFHEGCGIAKDDRKALECYLSAAKRGSTAAQFNLAGCFQYGEGTEKDEKQAVEWYSKAAEQGNARAMFALSQCFANGVGTSKDMAKARLWLERFKGACVPQEWICSCR